MKRSHPARIVTFLGLSLAFALIVLATPARADIAVTSISGGSSFGSFNGSDQTVGWEFQVNSAIQVTSLGFYDSDTSNPLTQTHEVGIWTTDGTLLGSATVQVNDPLSGSFRYDSVAAPFVLDAGQTYLIGAEVYSPFGDDYNIPASVTTASAISLLGSARSDSSSGFAAPTTVTSGNGRFGPNFQFEPLSVPEPASIASALIGVMTVAGWRRVRHRKPTV